MAKHLGEGAEQTRVGLAPEIGDAVGANHHQRMSQVLLDISVVDDELDAQRAVTLGCADHVMDQLGDWNAEIGRDLDRHAALVFAKRGAAREPDDLG